MKIKIFFVLSLQIVLAVLFLSCTQRLPYIDNIEPKIGRMGEIISLKGSNFGKERGESYVTIAGTAPTNSSYQTWTDNTIMLRVPETGESGLVYVFVNGKRSNGVLFSDIGFLPVPVEGEDPGFIPRIVSVSPRIGPPGTLITITGNNFGGSRDNSGVFFSREQPSGLFLNRPMEFIEVSELEFGYEFWSDREIRFRLPDGAVGGGFEVRTSRGNSRPASFEVSGMPGTKTFSDKRSYTVNYSMDIRVLDATRPNTLYLYVPVPVVSPSQRNVSLLSRNIDPFMENFRGTCLFKLDNLVAGSTARIDLSYQVDVYAQETSIRPQAIREDRTAILRAYTQSSNLLPSDNQEIITLVNQILGRERNPYQKARLIYEWFIREMTVTESMSVSPANVIAALESKQADPYLAALLYCTMVRAAGVPIVPVAGVLVNNNRQTLRHYWGEFWIDGLGWVPVDPAMGMGAVSSNQTRQDSLTYYFGNLDSNRIAFSKGELNLSQMDSRGRLVSHTRSYSLQNIWEEAVGGLESYSSLWGDIIITGIYVQ